jgi:hypothetical protein
MAIDGAGKTAKSRQTPVVVGDSITTQEQQMKRICKTWAVRNPSLMRSCEEKLLPIVKGGEILLSPLLSRITTNRKVPQHPGLPIFVLPFLPYPCPGACAKITK